MNFNNIFHLAQYIQNGIIPIHDQYENCSEDNLYFLLH